MVKGLTTTPTFMRRHGITDIDGAIVTLSKLVPELQVEALGNTHTEIVAEAHRILDLPLGSEPVFKVPISNQGVRACHDLTAEGHRVNLHLVYTLNQAYMAMAAGAAFVCPLAGRLQDQGHDAIGLFDQCVKMARDHGYGAKVMFSSVRHAEHVRQAILVGAHVCTAPWSVIKALCDNELTARGTAQFLEHSRLVMTKVREVIREANPVCTSDDTVMDALVKMTESRLGAVAIVDGARHLVGVLTDGDVRRRLQEFGQQTLSSPIGAIGTTSPLSVNAAAPLVEAVELFHEHDVDNVVVVEDNVVVGILDIQDLIKLGLLG